MAEKPAVNEKAVREIVDAKQVQTYFQPVVSLASKSIVGFEAFSRGGAAVEGRSQIEPATLFHRDLSPETKIDVDRLCRETALAQFKPIFEGHKELLLFMNLNPDILPHVDLQKKILMHQVASMDVDLGNVIIEFPVAAAVREEVVRFADMYRGLGFKLSLDNGGPDGNLDAALSAVRPAFVKIGPSLYDGEQPPDRLRGLVERTERFGAVLAAQGVESEEDAIRLLAAGVRLQQGYYYSKDEGGEGVEGGAETFARKIQSVHDKYKQEARLEVHRKKERFQTLFRTVGAVCVRLAGVSEDRFEDVCRTLVRAGSGLISLFVLDDRGAQVTSRPHADAGSGRLSASVIGSARGTDHSVRDYFLYLDMGYEKFLTPPFLSPFTGEKARLASRPIYNSEGLRYVVCVELADPE